MLRPESLEEFTASMPASYREAFDDEAVLAHAGVAARREASATRVEIWKDLPERVVAICIVADDRPGLLSQISAALVALEIDVVTAHAFCRARGDGTQEAIDILWIRRVARANGSIGPIRARDVAAIGDRVDALVRGKEKLEPNVDSMRSGRSARSAAESTRVLFERGAEDGTMVLTVEATDRPGLLLVVTKAIFRAGLQIIGLRATSEQGRASDRFHLAELDGKPLVQARLLTLQVEILSALEDESEDESGDSENDALEAVAAVG
jgi:UTP:GlnB (protein PII) uridylyltransferase